MSSAFEWLVVRESHGVEGKSPLPAALPTQLTNDAIVATTRNSWSESSPAHSSNAVHANLQALNQTTVISKRQAFFKTNPNFAARTRDFVKADFKVSLMACSEDTARGDKGLGRIPTGR